MRELVITNEDAFVYALKDVNVAEPLKNIYDSEYIEALGNAFAKEYTPFCVQEFHKKVFCEDWDELELKQRVSQICLSIHAQLGLPFTKACEVLKVVGQGFGGYAALYFPEYIERFGLDHWDESMDALSVLTQYSSAEFAIRPFILRNKKRAMAQMLEWSLHENEHIRRLASEGCRPRLPWAQALREFKKDASPILPILENLKDDPSLYVRKSVANNLNDISKDDPALALKLAKKWMSSPSKESIWIVKHGLRTLLKSSEPQALELFGLGNSSIIELKNFNLLTHCVFMGEELSFEFDLDVKADTKLRIEYALHFKNKRGSHGRKVFKLSEIDVESGEYEVTKNHKLKELTTRNFNEGVQFVEIIINGKSFLKTPFFLSTKENGDDRYFVYMIYTSKNTIYTGITTEPNRRFIEHLSGKKGAKYTKGNGPLAFIYLETVKGRSLAQKREAAIKQLSRKEKEALSGHNVLIFK